MCTCVNAHLDVRGAHVFRLNPRAARSLILDDVGPVLAFPLFHALLAPPWQKFSKLSGQVRSLRKGTTENSLRMCTCRRVRACTGACHGLCAREDGVGAPHTVRKTKLCRVALRNRVASAQLTGLQLVLTEREALEAHVEGVAVEGDVASARGIGGLQIGHSVGHTPRRFEPLCDGCLGHVNAGER